MHRCWATPPEDVLADRCCYVPPSTLKHVFAFKSVILHRSMPSICPLAPEWHAFFLLFVIHSSKRFPDSELLRNFPSPTTNNQQHRWLMPDVYFSPVNQGEIYFWHAYLSHLSPLAWRSQREDSSVTSLVLSCWCNILAKLRINYLETKSINP